MTPDERAEYEEALAEAQKKPLSAKIGVAILAGLAVLALGVAYAGWQSGLSNSSSSSVKSSSSRNDCRAVIQAARRDVIDNYSLMLSIDTARNHQLLGDGLLSRVDGGGTNDPLVAAYRQSQSDLDRDEGLAATLIQRLPSVDGVVKNGGPMPVLTLNAKSEPGIVALEIVRFSPEVSSQTFEPCPEV